MSCSKRGSRLIVAGDASGEWDYQVNTNNLWLTGTTVSGFSAGGYIPAHPDALRPALAAGLQAAMAGLGDMEIDVLPFSDAVVAHERMDSRALNGRIVLTPSA